MLSFFTGSRAREIFRRLLIPCLPTNAAYKGKRKWVATYRRMVALAYCAWPEQFVGMKQADVARFLDVRPRRFEKLLAAARATVQRLVRLDAEL